jgi:hypothetical protein
MALEYASKARATQEAQRDLRCKHRLAVRAKPTILQSECLPHTSARLDSCPEITPPLLPIVPTRVRLTALHEPRQVGPCCPSSSLSSLNYSNRKIATTTNSSTTAMPPRTTTDNSHCTVSICITPIMVFDTAVCRLDQRRHRKLHPSILHAKIPDDLDFFLEYQYTKGLLSYGYTDVLDHSMGLVWCHHGNSRRQY